MVAPLVVALVRAANVRSREISVDEDRPAGPVRTGPQLITYPDSLGGSLRVLARLLAGPLAGAFDGVHVLPPFPSTADRGFAPTTYREIDPAFGTWDDIAEIAQTHEVAIDLIVNHVSRRSAEFVDFEEHGRASRHAELFLTLDKVWPAGEPRPEDVARLFLRRAVPWSHITIRDTGTTERVWTTFGTGDPSEQIDVDVAAPGTRALIAEHLRRFAAHGVRFVRLDAVGYVIKRAGTSCFMVEPEIWSFLDWVRSIAMPLGIELLAEVHAERALQHRLAAHDVWVYDFVLPGVVLHALRTRSASLLADHLASSPRRQVTTLDTHDGIPIQPDLAGVLPLEAARALVDDLVAGGAGTSRVIAPAHRPDPSFDTHQVFMTYHSAVGADDDATVAARAIQLFARGIPQVYYVGLLAGDDDHASIREQGDGRAVNRHDYAATEIDAQLVRPVVGRLLRLIRLRREHPAFGGDVLFSAREGVLDATWRHGAAVARLEVDLVARRATVTASDGSGTLASFTA